MNIFPSNQSRISSPWSSDRDPSFADILRSYGIDEDHAAWEHIFGGARSRKLVPRQSKLGDDTNDNLDYLYAANWFAPRRDFRGDDSDDYKYVDQYAPPPPPNAATFSRSQGVPGRASDSAFDGTRLDGVDLEPPSKAPDPEARRRQREDAQRKAYDRMREILGQRPEQPSMYPRPGITGLMALLSGLSNNRFRPDDDPMGKFLGAFQGVRSDQYQQALSKWQREFEKAKIDFDEYMNQAATYGDQYDEELQEFQRRREKQELRDLENRDCQDSKTHAGSLVHAYMQPYLPNLQNGLTRAQKFLKRAAEDESRWAASGLEGPPMHDWQEAQQGSLTEAQQELGAAIIRHEMLQQMLGGFPDHIDALTPGQRRAKQELDSQFSQNEQLLEKLFGKNPKSPKLVERQRMFQLASQAMGYGADERAVLNRLRGLLLGVEHPDSKDGYFDYLIPAYGVTPMGGHAHSVQRFETWPSDTGAAIP